jgi:hypothetical protein
MGTSNKRLLSVCGLAGLIAVIAATAALAQTATVYCVNGATTTLPTTLTFAGGSREFGEGTAGAVISNSFDNSTFYLGFTSGGAGPFFFIPDSPTFDPATFLAPGYSTNSVSRGACAPGTHPKVPGSSFMCASGYVAQSNPDYVAGKEAMEDYLAPAFGRHYAFYVQGDLNGVQRAQAAAGSTPAGSFYCRLPEGLRVVPIIGSDGKQMLADTQGYLYDSGYANGETIGHPAYRVGP